MSRLTITRDKRVLLDGVEIPNVLRVSIDLDGIRDPEVNIRVSVDELEIEDYISPKRAAILADHSSTCDSPRGNLSSM